MMYRRALLFALGVATLGLPARLAAQTSDQPPAATCAEPTAVDSLAPPDSAPVPTRVVVPPLPVPRTVQGRSYTMTVPVSAAGEPIASDITFEPELEPVSYRRQVVQVVQRTMRFRPARRAGCDVPGHYTMQLAFR